MANKKITELTETTSAAADDVLAIVTVAGTAATKKITVANLTGNITQVSTTVNNAAVLRMKYDDLPIELVAAINGKIIVPISVTIVATASGATESSSDNLRIGWDATGSGSGSDNFIDITDMMNGITAGNIQSQSLAPYGKSWSVAYEGSAVSQPLEAWCSDVFNGGWSMVIYTTYYTITV
tara:strand:- start:38 stop:580 length:543 start_codon:yes stop_codon:yes gene_type:complete